MSKAALVIDMTETCIDCPCHFYDDNYGALMFECGVAKKEMHTDDVEAYKPDWCPLRELPERKEVPLEVISKEAEAYAEGFNDCLDAIEGNVEHG